jgi:hypothetical protein
LNTDAYDTRSRGTAGWGPRSTGTLDQSGSYFIANAIANPADRPATFGETYYYSRNQCYCP